MTAHALARQVSVSRPVLRSRSWAFPTVSLLCSAWAVYANVWRFRFPALAADEPTYAIAAWRYIHGDHALPPVGGLTNAHNFEHPPLAKLMFGAAQLLVGHPSIPADRLVAAGCTLLTALVVGVWVGRTVERWSGLLAAMLVAVLPMRVPDVDFRFGSYGMLDPVAEMFMTLSVVCAWLWFRRRGRASWAWAVATGVSVGLAAASKENGFLAAPGVVLLGLLLALRSRQLLRRIAQTVVAVTLSALAFAACYLPLGHPVAALRFMLTFQWHHSRTGHFVDVAGALTAHPPWWTFLWFAAHGLGWVVGVASVAACVAAVVLRHDRLVAWCLAALVGPVLFHSLVAGVVLPYYWVMWTPAWLALTAVGVHDLTGVSVRLLSRARRPRLPAVAGALVPAVAVAVFGVPAAADSVHLATQRLAGPQRIPLAMAGANLHGGLVIGGVPPEQLWDSKLPGPVSYRLPEDLWGYDTVAVGHLCGHPVPAGIRALLGVNLRRGVVHLLYRDATIAVYGGYAALQAPTPAQVAAQPPADASAAC
jgi:4-amino-4-deoxy-L-arabinose transferase-like glycosyltransferase